MEESTTDTSEQSKRGRPPQPMPDLIPDTSQNIARAILAGPPKKEWDYLKKAKRDCADSAL